MEKARGLELHNSVELVIYERGLDTHGAIDWLEHYAVGVRAGFLDNIVNFLGRGHRSQGQDLYQWYRSICSWQQRLDVRELQSVFRKQGFGGSED